MRIRIGIRIHLKSINNNKCTLEKPIENLVKLVYFQISKKRRKQEGI